MKLVEKLIVSCGEIVRSNEDIIHFEFKQNTILDLEGGKDNLDATYPIKLFLGKDKAVEWLKGFKTEYRNKDCPL